MSEKEARGFGLKDGGRGSIWRSREVVFTGGPLGAAEPRRQTDSSPSQMSRAGGGGAGGRGPGLPPLISGTFHVKELRSDSYTFSSLAAASGDGEA